MVVAGDAGIPLAEHLVEGFFALNGLDAKCRHALDGDVNEHPKGAKAKCHGRQQLGVLVGVDAKDVTERRHEGRSADARGKPAEGEPGAVGAGRGRAGDRLLVDVAHVLQRKAERAKERRQLEQVGAGAERDVHAVNGDDAVEPLQIQQHATRRRDRRE